MLKIRYSYLRASFHVYGYKQMLENAFYQPNDLNIEIGNLRVLSFIHG